MRNPLWAKYNTTTPEVPANEYAELQINEHGDLISARPQVTWRWDEVSADLTYIGIAVAGASESAPVWKIKRMVLSGTVTTLDFADANSNFDNVWADRASLTYG